MNSHNGNVPSKGRRAARRTAWTLAAVLGAAVSAAAGCSSDEKTECGGIEQGGACLEECVESACPAGNRCVLNACRPPCETDADCPASFNCLEAYVDGTEQTGLFCLRHGYSADGSTGQSTPCSADDQCDQRRGYTCRNGECRIWGCLTHDDCGSVGACVPEPGTPDRFCKPDDALRGPGQYNTRCPFGTECDADDDFFCLGAGEGDIDAYCTQAGCKADQDCPTGYHCTTQRAGFPCEARCGLSGDPTDPQCVTAEQFERPGAGWSCGPYSLLRSMCVKRRFCIRCETDADCSALPNQICAKDAGGTKICTTVCDANILNSCPGGSSSYCDLFDEELGVPTCSHRYRPESGGDSFYSCVGAGAPCHPCLEDTDCGPMSLCLRVPTTGERFCMDPSFECTVTGGVSSCPETPGHIKMLCFGEADGLQPGDFFYHRCYAPDIEPSLQSTKHSCWPKG